MDLTLIQLANQRLKELLQSSGKGLFFLGKINIVRRKKFKVILPNETPIEGNLTNIKEKLETKPFSFKIFGIEEVAPRENYSSALKWELSKVEEGQTEWEENKERSSSYLDLGEFKLFKKPEDSADRFYRYSRYTAKKDFPPSFSNFQYYIEIKKRRGSLY